MKKDNELMKKIAKKGAIILVAGTLVATMFTGCVNTNDASVMQETSQYELKRDYSSSSIRHRDISDSVLVKYLDANGKESSIALSSSVVYRDIFCDQYCGGKVFFVGNEVNCLYYWELSDDAYKTANKYNRDMIESIAIDKYIETLGKQISKENFGKYVVAEYGEKAYYSAEEIDKLLCKLNNELPLEDEKTTVQEECSEETKQDTSSVNTSETESEMAFSGSCVLRGKILYYKDGNGEVKHVLVKTNETIIAKPCVTIYDFYTSAVLYKEQGEKGIDRNDFFEDVIYNYENMLGTPLGYGDFYTALSRKYPDRKNNADTYTKSEIDAVVNELVEQIDGDTMKWKVNGEKKQAVIEGTTLKYSDDDPMTLALGNIKNSCNPVFTK